MNNPGVLNRYNYETILNKEEWTAESAYYLSKLYVMMFTSAFKHMNFLSKDTTLILSCPARANTKLIDNKDWSKKFDLENATHTYKMATLSKYQNGGGFPKYYNKCIV